MLEWSLVHGKNDQRLTDRLTQHSNSIDRLTQHSNSIDNTLKNRNKAENFDSALTEHIFDHLEHTIVFNQGSLISHDIEIVQCYKEAVKIFKYQHLGPATNRDSGDLRINESYFDFLKFKRSRYFSSP